MPGPLSTVKEHSLQQPSALDPCAAASARVLSIALNEPLTSNTLNLPLSPKQTRMRVCVAAHTNNLLGKNLEKTLKP